MTITLGVADPGACWVVAAAACHGGGNLRPRFASTRARGHTAGGPSMRLPDPTAILPLGARPRSTAFPGDGRDLDSGFSGPAGRHRRGGARSGSGEAESRLVS